MRHKIKKKASGSLKDNEPDQGRRRMEERDASLPPGRNMRGRSRSPAAASPLHEPTAATRAGTVRGSKCSLKGARTPSPQGGIRGAGFGGSRRKPVLGRRVQAA